MLRFARTGVIHEIDVDGTKVFLKSMSLGSRMELLKDTERLIDVKDGKLANVGLLASLIHSIDDRQDVEAAINELETADDLLKLIRAVVRFATLGETEAGNSQDSLSGKAGAGTPTGLSQPTLNEADVAADETVLASKG